MNLELKNIKKAYGKNTVLNGVNATIENGIYGFLGANGVGKTTLFKIINGFLTNYQGKVIYPELHKKGDVLLGFLPQSFGGYPDMTIYQFLSYLGNIKVNLNQDKVNEEIDKKLNLFNLTNIKAKKLKALSGGQLRRVGLAQAFLFNPKIVMLDEPTTGLDPTERINFKNYISSFGQEQIILISTHIVSDLEFIAKEIFILKDGHFVMKGTERELINTCIDWVWEADFDNEIDMHNELKRHNKGETYSVSMIYEAEGMIKGRIISANSPVPNAVKVKPTLNDVYLINFKKEAHSDG
ncbi:ATP-binding cassette domain-containing protein [Amphibacillus sp. Q70]|uniref:ATP-binding cassette domain-containing protein n=1 Tax=Amphibacillus sp. Q70 TaxID=3453416 RepID=UPI003F842ABC